MRRVSTTFAPSRARKGAARGTASVRASTKTSSARFGETFRYRFDNLMAKGTGALIALLGLATLVLILLAAAISEVFRIFPGDGPDDPTFGETLWGNLMRAMDAGTVAGDTGPGFRALELVVTIGGILIVASLIGIISGAFDAKVDELRKGRSRVIEKEHTLILGWSSKVFPIISELVIANESRRHPSIVILADRDKVEMDEAIRSELGRTGNTRIITRSGSPMNLTDLERASPSTARSIIVLAPDDADAPDSVVIKTALALTNNPRRGSEQLHIVGEIQEPANLEAARLVGRDEAHWVLAHELISRITVQSCRQSGLSVVYQELLDFDGDEIYFTEQPTLVGSAYISTQFAFETATVMGIVKGDDVLVNPPAATVYEAGDQLIVIAEDDSLIRLGANAGTADVAAISVATTIPAPPERTLVLGFNAGLRFMLAELSEYVAEGSSVTVVAGVRPPVLEGFTAMPVHFVQGDTTSRVLLESLGVHEFDHVIVVPYEDVDAQEADARTLITLLHLREMADRTGAVLNVVSEMIDDANRELAEVTRADDFIVSDKLISLLLSQVSENRKLRDVFDTLFASEGSEIYLRPAELYIEPGATVDFYTVLEAAHRRGETAIGYRNAAESHDSDAGYGVTVNPRKTDQFTFEPGDAIIVLAES